MKDVLYMPKIFQELITKMDNVDDLTDDQLNAYFGLIAEDTNFIPELVSIIGPDNFKTLVYYLGGNVMKIPKVQDIIRAVRKSTQCPS